jgi:hypothetical protein
MGASHELRLHDASLKELYVFDVMADILSQIHASQLYIKGIERARRHAAHAPLYDLLIASQLSCSKLTVLIYVQNCVAGSASQQATSTPTSSQHPASHHLTREHIYIWL